MAELGQLIRKTRELQGIESQALAAKVGVSKGTISNLERGVLKTTPEASFLRAISATLGIPVETMLGVLGYLDSEPSGTSGAIQRLAPVIDRYDWSDEALEQLARVIDSVGRLHAGTFPGQTKEE